MKILVAGATGAIGRPLVSQLQEGGHHVLALTRNASRAAALEDLGVTPVVADVMDRESLLRAVDGQSADTVIHELTALSKPPARHSGMKVTNELRITGTKHLLEAARQMGAKRFVTQSMVPGYGFVDHGTDPITEDAPFGTQRGLKTDAVTGAMRSTEQQAFEADGIDGIALRYGAFYGPGPASDTIIELLRKRKVPVPKSGGGTAGWTYIEDAAAATALAVENGRPNQAYNVVDDEPVAWDDFLQAMAEAFDAPPPRRLPAWLIRLAAPYFADLMVSMSMRVSNAKAKVELGWKPTMPSYREGIAATLALR